jgi:hypothetical protein
MKDEITIPDHFPDMNEEKFKIEAKRREKYSLIRDLQAQENNDAIARRLAKGKEDQSEDLTQFKSENAAENSQT